MGAFEGAAGLADIPTDVGTDAGPIEPLETPEPSQEPELPETPEQPPEEPELEEKEKPEEAAKPMLPRQLTKALREMSEAHPEHKQALKELQDTYFRHAALSKHFPTVEEALDAKTTLDAVGGKEGIQQLRSWESTIQDIDRRVDAGDPAIVDEMFSSSPEGMSKLIPRGIEMLERANPEAFRDTVRPLVLRELDGSGLTNYLDGARDELRSGNADRAIRYLDAISNSIQRYRQDEQDRQSRREDPVARQLQTERQQIQSERQNMLRDSVQSGWRQHLNTAIPKAIAQRAAQAGLAPGARTDLIRAVAQEIGQRLGADQFYLDTVKGLYAQGDRERIIRYGTDAIDRVLNGAVGTAWTRGGYDTRGNRRASPNGAPQKPQAASTQGDRPIPLSQRPNIRDIDDKRTTRDMIAFERRAWLKSGKLVSWK